MIKKEYQKPVIENVKLRVTESVLTACKLAVVSNDPYSGSGKACSAGKPASRCQETAGS